MRMRKHFHQYAAHALDGWATYFKQPILACSLTYVMLFFNVALSPGGLITAFLTSWGLDGTGMAVFRVGCAGMGFLGTFCGPYLIQRYGLVGAGMRALIMQCVLLGGATAIYAAFLSSPLPARGAFGLSGAAAPFGLVVFAAAVVVSRAGIWVYDMVNAQLFQTTVLAREVAAASSAEMALCSFSELLMLGLAAYVITPASYGVLVYGSFAAVIGANVLFYYGWVLRQGVPGEGEDVVPRRGAAAAPAGQ